jgi:hypothetical protein
MTPVLVLKENVKYALVLITKPGETKIVFTKLFVTRVALAPAERRTRARRGSRSFFMGQKCLINKGSQGSKGPSLHH